MRNNKNFEIGEGKCRINVGSLTLMYITDVDELSVGFLNADKLNYKDLEDIHEATGKMIKYIEGEKLKNGKY